jgi:DnaJ-like protein
MIQNERRETSRSASEPRIIRVEMKDGLGNPRWVTADLVDSCANGIGALLATPLAAEGIILAHGRFPGSRSGGGLRVRVVWCREQGNSKFRAGLQFLSEAQTSSSGQHDDDASIDPEDLDCYETLQLSPNADRETVDRVYRILAQRYHPDNSETGNPDVFIRLSKAHRILSNPEARAGYDARHHSMKQSRWKILDPATALTRPEAEKQKRHNILGALYNWALRDPESAGPSIRALEELLGCPYEHLAAALWYLKGKNYICRGDNGRYSITVQGFDEAEKQCFPASSPGRLLAEAPAEGS